MFKVEKKPKTPNIVWDSDNNCPLCKFINEGFETNDKEIADKLKRLGHTVKGKADVKPLEKMKVDELKAYAEKNNIELSNTSGKTDILKKIIQSPNNEEAGNTSEKEIFNNGEAESEYQDGEI